MTDEPAQLSCCVLTFDSEKYLADVVGPIRYLVDDLVIVDSGSTDRTEDIARDFDARFIAHPLESFPAQRTFALDSCRNNWVLELDSDELPDATFVASLTELKAGGFRGISNNPGGFKIRRRWFVLGREVHAFYPISSPDFPLRLYRRDKVGYRDAASSVHEEAYGVKTQEVIGGSVKHFACDSRADLERKLELYTLLAATDMARRGVRPRWWKTLAGPSAAWLKWYIRKGGWQDGWVGLVLARYAHDYTRLKYRKLRERTGSVGRGL